MPPEERNRRQQKSGSRFLLLGGVLALVGIVIMVLAGGLLAGVGVAVALLACLPTIVGATLLAMAGIDRRARAGKPFA